MVAARESRFALASDRVVAVSAPPFRLVCACTLSARLRLLRAAACGMDVKATAILLQAMVPDVSCTEPPVQVLSLAAQAMGDPGDVATLGTLLEDAPRLTLLDLSGHTWVNVVGLPVP